MRIIRMGELYLEKEEENLGEIPFPIPCSKGKTSLWRNRVKKMQNCNLVVTKNNQRESNTKMAQLILWLAMLLVSTTAQKLYNY